ncbi:MAG: chemotaxis protein CheW [Actinomycetota bacterium]
MSKEAEFTQILRERAARLSQPVEEPPSDLTRVVVFRLGAELYGLEVAHVVEIFRPERLTPVPGAPIYIEGVTNLRGDIVTVIDLKAMLTGEARAGSFEEGRVLVGATGRDSAGLLVDEVIGIYDIRAASIDPPLTTLEKLAADHLVGEFKLEKEMVGLLNLTNILEA